MVRPRGNVAVRRTVVMGDGSIMRRVLAIAAAATSLAGCSPTPDYLKMDYYRSAPAAVQLQLESTPPGAAARASMGPGCKTPCSVSVAPAEGVTSFLVNYSMPGVQGTSVPVQVARESGGMFSADTIKLSPNPVVVELRPPAPPPKAAKPMRAKRKKPARAPPADA